MGSGAVPKQGGLERGNKSQLAPSGRSDLEERPFGGKSEAIRGCSSRHPTPPARPNRDTERALPRSSTASHGPQPRNDQKMHVGESAHWPQRPRRLLLLDQ